MKTYQLTVTPREGTGRSASRRLRKAEKIPAILYGKHTKAQNLAVNAPEFIKLRKAISGRSALIELKREAGASALAFLQEIQRDPITDKYLHLDLQEVKENEKMIINVAILVVGEAYGVKTEGGILETAAHRLRIRCLPKDLPDFIEVNVTELKVGGAIHVSELSSIAGVEYLDDKNQTASRRSGCRGRGSGRGRRCCRRYRCGSGRRRCCGQAGRRESGRSRWQGRRESGCSRWQGRRESGCPGQEVILVHGRPVRGPVVLHAVL